MDRTRPLAPPTDAAASRPWHVPFAALLIGAATVVRWLLTPLVGEQVPFTPLMIAVIVAAWRGGARPALVTMLGGFVAVWYLFIPVHGSFVLATPASLLGMASFLLIGLVVIAFGENAHTTRRRAARQSARVHEEKERFRRAADAVNGIIYEYDLATGTTERSRGLAEVLGYGPQEAEPTGAWWRGLMHPDDRNSMLAAFGSATTDRLAQEYRIRHRDGRWVWVEDRALVVRDDAGRPTRLVGCTVDVTARREGEERIRAITRELQRTFDASATGLTRCDRQLRYLAANAAYAGIVGVPIEEIVGRTLPEVIGDEAFAQVRERIAQVLRGERVDFEVVVAFRGSGQRALHVVYTPDEDADGSVVGWVSSITDLTDRRRAEEELERQNRVIRAVNDNTTELIFMKDRAGRLTYANAATLTVMGLDRDAAFALEQPERLTGDADASVIATNDRYVLETGESLVAEEAFVCADGVRRLYLTAKSPLRDEDGAVVGVIGVSRDVTEVKRSAAQLAATEARWATLLQQLPVGVGMLSLDGTVTPLNPLMYRFTPERMPSVDPARRSRWRSWR
ncbi:MAG: PAS domain-containing protein, partial [Gemmatimonadaceae bacterium]|nr:PAS domain-containing protein [Gemmatimonadaceae bacterium]